MICTRTVAVPFTPTEHVTQSLSTFMLIYLLEEISMTYSNVEGKQSKKNCFIRIIKGVGL